MAERVKLLWVKAVTNKASFVGMWVSGSRERGEGRGKGMGAGCGRKREHEGGPNPSSSLEAR